MNRLSIRSQSGLRTAHQQPGAAGFSHLAQRDFLPASHGSILPKILSQFESAIHGTSSRRSSGGAEGKQPTSRFRAGGEVGIVVFHFTDGQED